MAKKNAAAVELGRRGGRAKVPKGIAMLSATKRREIVMKGVEARQAKVGPKRRAEIARKAAAARWGKKGKGQ